MKVIERYLVIFYLLFLIAFRANHYIDYTYPCSPIKIFTFYFYGQKFKISYEIDAYSMIRDHE